MARSASGDRPRGCGAGWEACEGMPGAYIMFLRFATILGTSVLIAALCVLDVFNSPANR